MFLHLVTSRYHGSKPRSVTLPMQCSNKYHRRVTINKNDKRNDTTEENTHEALQVRFLPYLSLTLCVMSVLPNTLD